MFQMLYKTRIRYTCWKIGKVFELLIHRKTIEISLKRNFPVSVNCDGVLRKNLWIGWWRTIKSCPWIRSKLQIIFGFSVNPLQQPSCEGYLYTYQFITSGFEVIKFKYFRERMPTKNKLLLQDGRNIFDYHLLLLRDGKTNYYL